MIMLGITIKLFDQVSNGVRGITQQLEGLRGNMEALSRSVSSVGRNLFGTGLIAGGTLAKPIAAFAQLEDASIRLKATMMDKNGMTGAFAQVNALAVKLGDQLPGTSADFLNMMAALKAQGISDESILGGVGEASAKMAVLLKKTPEEMAVFSAKLKTALGVADSDMLQFMDTIQRTYFMGVDATEMMYAFARSAGALKTIKQQGLEAGKALAPLYAIWVKGGMSGETVGTGFASITGALLDAKKVGKGNALLKAMGMGPLKFTDKKGNFAGIENMIQQFDKLKNLDATKLNAVLKEIFGGGQDQQMVATLVTEGIDGYRRQVEAMEQQADLQKRVGAQLKTLANLWEAATGTFTNLLASLGEAMGDDLKALTVWFGELSASIKSMVEENPALFKMLGQVALLGTGFMIVGGAVLMAAGALGMLVAGFAAVSPIVLALGLLAGAAVMVYANWENIKGGFFALWEDIKDIFGQAGDWIYAKMQALSDWVLSKITKLSKAVSNLLPDWMRGPSDVNVNRSDVLGPAKPGAVSAPDGKVSGDIRIHVDQEGRVSSVVASTNSPRAPFIVDAGYSMVAP